MATNDDMAVTVSVEATIHNAIRKALQEIDEEYGILVREVRVEWGNDTMLADRKPHHFVRELTVLTATVEMPPVDRRPAGAAPRDDAGPKGPPPGPVGRRA